MGLLLAFSIVIAAILIYAMGNMKPRLMLWGLAPIGVLVGLMAYFPHLFTP